MARWVVFHARVIALSLGLAACGARNGASEEPRSRALRFEERSRALARSGDLSSALHFATGALVVRIAACGYECPEPAYSFVQLGDLRLRNGQPEHAAQSYARAREVLAQHRATHREWIDAVEARLALACGRASLAPPACAR